MGQGSADSQRQGAKQLVGRRADGRCSRLGRLRRLLSQWRAVGGSDLAQRHTWWALLSLPLANGKHLSLLWDGSTLHATQPVRSSLPVELYKRIQIHGTDEFDFDPYFELTRDSDGGDTATTHRFKPKFIAS